MGDYNLSGLNPRDFQHLIQAIARKQIAPGVTAFGDGKDGARDLTFTGRMNYPSVTAPWDGYLVLGCKFCQQPTGNRSKDGDWAKRQLEADLKKFLSRKRALSKPKYYLFVTNVALSGVAKRGSRDQASALLRTYKPKLQLKGFGVWDYNDIRGFLDGDEDIRSAYGNFVTSGDILATIKHRIDVEREDFADVMDRFLQKELIADTTAKLQSAGEDPEAQIPLANVFVDLPFAKTSEAAALASQAHEEKAPQVVQYLVRSASFVLRRTGFEDAPETESGRNPENARTSRFVIVGGPGQGKSTLGQYLSQLYRASILRDRPAQRLDDRVPGIIKQLDHQRQGVGGLPKARRFPLRIELRSFSYALANNPTLTLLEYIRSDIARLGSGTVSINDLKSWLENHPWLVVLDGLDEVPPSSNRTEVMTQVDHFRVDAASVNSDLMLVATTRPQSYSMEFPPDLFPHLYLIPLSPKHALAYGRRLAEARCGADERRRDDLVRSLEKACKNEATARLMQSPLQVTIMATLLEETGEPPQQRYRLFAEYYRTIYKRETRRRLLGGILSERQTDIDTIHAHAGLLIHLSGEKTTVTIDEQPHRDAEAALSDHQFRELVRRRLERIKVPAVKAAQLLDRITDGSLQRLVFLVRPREGWVQFDITSLKEFMAAEALMIGSDNEVRQRLESIAPATYWRNVFLFAIGKCFVQREHLLDHIVGICEQLNEDKSATRILGGVLPGRAAKTILWGSRLALDILEDGTAQQYPEYEVRLARLALQLVKTRDVEALARLAAVFHDDLTSLYKDAISDRLGQTDFWSRFGAYQLLLGLVVRELSWARALAESSWPSASEEVVTLLRTQDQVHNQSWLLERFLNAAANVSPWWFNNWYYAREDPTRMPVELPNSWATIIEYDRPLRPSKFEIANSSEWRDVFPRFMLTHANLGDRLYEAYKTINPAHEDWALAIAGARFGSNPSAQTLGEELRWLAGRWKPSSHSPFGEIPWPLQACLRMGLRSDGLGGIAELAERGALGDTADWERAEARWKRLGVGDLDLFGDFNDQLPFEPLVGERGFPIMAVYYNAIETSKNFDTLITRLTKIGRATVRSAFAMALLQFITSRFLRGRIIESVSANNYRKLCELGERDGIGLTRFCSLDLVGEIVGKSGWHAEWTSLLEWLNQEQFRFNCHTEHTAMLELLMHVFLADPESHRDLLPAITCVAGSAGRLSIPRKLLELSRSWPALAGFQASLLALGVSDLTEYELQELVKKLFETHTEDSQIWDAFKIAARVSDERSAAFGLAVLETNSPSSIWGDYSTEMATQALADFLHAQAEYLQLCPTLLRL